MSRHLARLFILLVLVTGAFAAGFKVADPVEVLWSGKWYKATVVAVNGDTWRISYEGYGSNWDEVVGPDRIRLRSGPEGAPPPAEPSAAVTVSPAKTPVTTTTTVASSTATPKTFVFPAHPAGGNGGLEGAYLRVVSWFFNGRISLNQEGWFFTKEGRVSLNPEGGFAFADFTTTQVARKSDGVYKLAGDTLTITWADGSQPTSYELKPGKKGALLFGGPAATLVKGFARGWRSDAQYEGGASAVGGGSYVASSNSLQLHRDGTFGGDSIGSISASTSGTSVGASSSNSTAGRYQFDGYTLTLTHADGRVERRTVFAFGETGLNGAPEYIWREGTMLRRIDAAK